MYIKLKIFHQNILHRIKNRENRSTFGWTSTSDKGKIN